MAMPRRRKMVYSMREKGVEEVDSGLGEGVRFEEEGEEGESMHGVSSV